MIKKDIKVANEILDSDEFYSSDARSHIYGYTNEELDLFLPVLPIEGNRVLTVASSGDHVLGSVFHGASDIDAFDINPLQIQYCKLKQAAMLALNVDDFNKYFFNTDYSSIFSRTLYAKIRDFLDNDSRLFWDSLYNNGFDLKFEKLISNFQLPDLYIKKLDYTKEDNYEKTRSNLLRTNINYIISDFFKIHKHINGKYDVVILSNMYKWFDNKQRKAFLEYIKKHLENHLTDDGVMSVYTSVNGGRVPSLEQIAEQNDNMNIYGRNGEVTITYKKTRSI